MKPRTLHERPTISNRYSVVWRVGDKYEIRTVEAARIFGDAIGLRRDGKVWVLDHITSGWRIDAFRLKNTAIQAIRELLVVSDFLWKEPSLEIKAQVKEILSRLGSVERGGK